MERHGAGEERIQRWLNVLRDGGEFEKIAARRGLAGVFERRGMVDEAIELLESNIQAGVRSAETLRWLSRLYQARGDEVSSLEAALDSSQLRAAPIEAEPLAPVAAEARSPRSVASRRLATSLAVIVGMGILVGSIVWLLSTFLKLS
jgi:hypothetical protein